jgi:hypothetical protein
MKAKYLAITVISALTAFIIGHVTNCKEGEKKAAYEYTFDVDETGYDIYSDGKQIGRLNYGTNPSLDSLIDKDNL